MTRKAPSSGILASDETHSESSSAAHAVATHRAAAADPVASFVDLLNSSVGMKSRNHTPAPHRRSGISFRRNNSLKNGNCLSTRAFYGGPYRARTDDIHGVNVALYQLS